MDLTRRYRKAADALFAAGKIDSTRHGEMLRFLVNGPKVKDLEKVVAKLEDDVDLLG